jgi:hypothetical protein
MIGILILMFDGLHCGEICILTMLRIRFVPHREHSVSTKPNRLMLFRETVAVYCENHTEHINALCGQNTELLNVANWWYI